MILKNFIIVFCAYSLFFLYKMFRTWYLYAKEIVSTGLRNNEKSEFLRLYFFKLLKQYMILNAITIFSLVVLTFLFNNNN